MDTPITRAEHEEFRRRMEDEHKRMNHRLGDLEETVRQIGELNCQRAKSCPVRGADGTEPVQTRNKAGRIGKPRWRNVEKSCWIRLNGSNQHHSRIYLFSDWHVKEEMSMFKNCVLKVSVDTKKWLKAAGIRAVKTMAQTAVAVIGTGAVISAVDWQMVVSSAVVAGVVSVLTSVAGIPEVAEGKSKPSILLRRKGRKGKI